MLCFFFLLPRHFSEGFEHSFRWNFCTVIFEISFTSILSLLNLQGATSSALICIRVSLRPPRSIGPGIFDELP